MKKKMTQKEHPLYSTWKNMKSRCYVKSNTSYKYYGAKGVTVDERWHTFENFVEDVDNHLENGHLLYQKDYQLDKDIKGDKIYSLKNCMVITAEKNKRIANTSAERAIVATKGNEIVHFKSITEASRVLGIKRGDIQSCLKVDYHFKYCEEKP